MEALTDIQSIGVVTLAVALVAIAVRRVAERFGEDLYDAIKGVLGALIGRVRRSRAKAAPAVLLEVGSVAQLSGQEEGAPALSAPPLARLADATLSVSGSGDAAEGPKAGGSPPEIRTAAGLIHDLGWLADGDESRLYRARLKPGDGGVERSVVVKVPVAETSSDLLRGEASTLDALAAQAGQQAKHLPRVLARFRLADAGLALVLEHLDGLTLAQLRARFPDGIEPRHMLWILRRALSLLGYAHSQGVLHGNLTPDHILIRPSDHNVWLIDWTRSIGHPRGSGQAFRVVHPVYGPPEASAGRPALPSSDLYSLALCTIVGLGGEPGALEPPPRTPEPLARLLRSLLMESPVQRPQDAWELYHRLEKIRDQLFGPHRFVELVVD